MLYWLIRQTSADSELVVVTVRVQLGHAGVKVKGPVLRFFDCIAVECGGRKALLCGLFVDNCSLSRMGFEINVHAQRTCNASPLARVMLERAPVTATEFTFELL